VIKLAPFSNQVIFKKAFTDPEVLESFVRDVAGIEFQPAKIETEKKFTPPVGGIDFALDIFAESADGRVVVELQRVRYDSHFDRFLEYFAACIIEQAKSHKDYRIARQVVMIVLLTAPYKLKDKAGRTVEDSVLISQLDPQTLGGEVRQIYGHKLIFLNPRFPFDDVPPALADWLRLVNLSLIDQELADTAALEALLDTTNPAVTKAATLTLWDGLTPAELAAFIEAKETEKTTALILFDLAEERRLKVEAQAQAEAAQAQLRLAQAQADADQRKAQLLADRLRALGLDPDEVG
jgi:hypothetical protein